MKTILILTANPQGTSRLRLDKEVREIDEGLRRSQYREQFNIVARWATRTNDLRRALLDYSPEVVHFSGHGVGDQGLVLEDEAGNAKMVGAPALAELFQLFENKIECVLLNACYSERQAQAISQHANYVIGMHQDIGDRTAIQFAVGFYDALGAGRSYDDAFAFGRSAIALAGIPEHLTPVLIKRHQQQSFDPHQSHYDRIVNAIVRNQVVPFLGPEINLCDRPNNGIKSPTEWSANGPYPPSRCELAAYLDKECGSSMYFRDVYCPLCDPRSMTLPTDCPIMTGRVTRLDLPHVSEYLNLTFGEGSLADALNKLTHHTYTPNSIHQFFAHLPQRLARKGYTNFSSLLVTTTLDSTLEQAFQAANQPFDLVSYLHREQEEGAFIHQRFRRQQTGDGESKICAVGEATVIDNPNTYGELDDDCPIILKLYGSASWKGQLRPSFVITEDHYIDYLAHQDITQIVPSSLLGKLRNNHIWFLGYSLSYWNQRVILNRIWPTQRDRRRKWWAVQNNPTVLDQNLWHSNNVEFRDILLEDYMRTLNELLGALPEKEVEYAV